MKMNQCNQEEIQVLDVVWSSQYQVSHLEMTHADVNCRNVPAQSAGGLIADNCVHILTDGYLGHNPCFIITCLLHICD